MVVARTARCPIPASVFMLQGITTIPPVVNEPDEIASAWSPQA
jgi:hypothetical protein